MTIILGIDAAWTASQPSGVALVSSAAGNWRLIFAGSSSRHLLDHSKEGLISNSRPLGSVAEPTALLAAAGKIAEAPVDLVAVDMPLSLEPITARRVSDNLVSAAYGARHCSTHTPSVIRPGKISDDLKAGFERCGYRLLTRDVGVPGLMEVYPHPAPGRPPASFADHPSDLKSLAQHEGTGGRTRSAVDSDRADEPVVPVTHVGSRCWCCHCNFLRDSH
jgi:predicted RNase H-like nuclease